MIYVFESGSVVYDDSTINEEQKTKAVVVESLPTPQTIEGKIPKLRANLSTNTVYFEYIDIPIKRPSVDDYLLDLDFRLSMIELGI